jgi:hypothetical protein
MTASTTIAARPIATHFTIRMEAPLATIRGGQDTAPRPPVETPWRRISAGAKEKRRRRSASSFRSVGFSSQQDELFSGCSPNFVAYFGRQVSTFAEVHSSRPV